MGAVALSRQDEEILGSLQKSLHIPSKSQVIHRALEVLRQVITREQLGLEIKRSVAKCSEKDLGEHQDLKGAAAFHRLTK